MRSTRSNRTPSFSIPCRKHFWYLEQWSMQVLARLENWPQFWALFFFEKVMDLWHLLAMLKGTQKRPQIVYWWAGKTFEKEWKWQIPARLTSFSSTFVYLARVWHGTSVLNVSWGNCAQSSSYWLLSSASQSEGHLGWSSWRRPCKPRKRRPRSGTRRPRRRTRDNSASVVPLHPWSSGKDNHNDDDEEDDLDLWEAVLCGGRA